MSWFTPCQDLETKVRLDISAANVFDAWAYEREIALRFITPGKSTENSLVEWFNRRLRD